MAESQAMMRAERQAQSWKNRYTSMRQNLGETVHGLIRTAEIVSTSLGLGMIQGSRAPGKEVAIGPLPLELVTGLLGHTVSLASAIAGRADVGSHFAAVGDAGIGSFTYVAGRGLMAEWRARKKKGGTTGDDFAARLAQIADQAA